MSGPSHAAPAARDGLDEHTAPRLASAALVTVDVQRDLLDDGAFCVPGTSAVLPRVGALAAAFRATGLPVVHLVRLYDPASGDVDRCRRAAVAAGQGMLRPGTAGSQLAPGLGPADVELDSVRLLGGHPQQLGPHEWVLYKPRWGGFYRTALHEQLGAAGVSTVVVAGCNFPNCPRTTVYEASERDYRVALVTDAVSGFDDRGAAELSGIGVALVTAASLVESLAASARG